MENENINNSENDKPENSANSRENETDIPDPVMPEDVKIPDEESSSQPDTDKASGTEDDGAPDFEKTEADKTENSEIPESSAPVYTWSYAGVLSEDRHEKKKKARHGAMVYACVVTVLFAVCFGILGGLLVYGTVNGFSGQTVYSDRVVYVRDESLDTEDALTVQEIYAKVLPSTVCVNVVTESGEGSGTGFVITEDGYIVTNYHVIEDATSISVLFSDESEKDATLVGGHEASDIAVIKVDTGTQKLQAVEFGTSSDLLVGDEIVAIGNPSGSDLFGSVSVGYISGLDRELKFYNDNGLLEKAMKLIQINAGINPGNSGGPLCDMYGRVIGINTMKLKTTYNYEAVGFAIPSDEAQEVIKELIETGEYNGEAVAAKGVSLGISVLEVTKGFSVTNLIGQELVDDSGNPIVAEVDGILVLAITDENSSAYGILQPYDYITKINGEKAFSTEQVHDILAKLRVGDTLKLEIYRDGKYMDVDVVMK